MRPSLFCSLLLLIASSLSAQPIQESGWVPFELVKNKVILPVTVGEVTYRFILDTGGILGVAPGVKEQHQMAAGKPYLISDINRVEKKIETAIVPELTIGDWHFKDRRAFVDDVLERYPSSCLEADGMIGRDFFDDILLQFDFAQRRLRMTTQRDVLDLTGHDRTKMRLSRRGLPDVKLQINGKNAYVEFDSGSGDFFSFRTDQAEALLAKTPEKVLPFRGIFSFGISQDDPKITTRYAVRVDELVMAGTSFRNFYSDQSKITEPRIGADVLRYGIVTLDYQKGWWYFKPYPGKVKPTGYETFGFDVARIDGTTIVKWVLEGSPAAGAGLSSGDVLLEINDQPVGDFTDGCEGYLNGYTFHRADVVKLLIKTVEGDTHSLQLLKRKLR
jgi:hypothetical protein